LVENAIKYRSDKRNLHLSIATRNDKKYLIIEISDNGVGISKENQKFIFDKFYRVPTGDVHDVKGFGLGLFYVRSIIEKHGGKVTLKSTFGEGTVFSIYLPLKLSNRLEQFVSQ
jgi:two-component system phosphate regulon sensor histidine kinase PhoR